MTPSARIVAFIQGFEKCSLTAYMPTAHDVPTIGWGSTGPDIVMGLHWTQEQCDERFARDLARFAMGVSSDITSPTNQNQFDALVSFAYNEGLGHLAGSTLLRLHNAGHYAEAANEFAKWNLQGGIVLGGLVKRRAAEQAIYKEPA